jgi:hypothetical protein
MNKAAAKSWLKIYRVIDCIGALFTRTPWRWPQKFSTRRQDHFRVGHFNTGVKRQASFGFRAGIGSFAGYRISRARIP